MVYLNYIDIICFLRNYELHLWLLHSQLALLFLNYFRVAHRVEHVTEGARFRVRLLRRDSMWC